MSKSYFKKPKIILGQIVLIGLLSAGVSITALHANRIDSPSQNQPISLIDQTGTEQRALNKIAKKDSGRAKVYYNRQTHVLHFVILNMWSVPAFKSHKIKIQTRKFKHLADISDVTPELSISPEAQRREQIRKKENHEQAIQDKIDEQKIQQQQQQQAAQKKADQAIKNKIKAIKQKQQNKAKAQQKNKIKQQLKNKAKHNKNNKHKNRHNNSHKHKGHHRK